MPGEVVASDEHTVAFCDISPATDGHTLVVTRRHVADLFELDAAETGPLMASVKRVAETLRAALAPDGVNLLQSNGAAAFQTVFHLHVHVVPRYADDGLTLPWTPTPGDPEAIAATAERLRAQA